MHSAEVRMNVLTGNNATDLGCYLFSVPDSAFDGDDDNCNVGNSSIHMPDDDGMISAFNYSVS